MQIFQLDKFFAGRVISIKHNGKLNRDMMRIKMLIYTLKTR